MEIIQETIDSQGCYHAETGISVNEWKRLLTDGTISETQIDALLCFYRDPTRSSTCSALAEKYDSHSNAFNVAITRLGANVQQHLNRFKVLGTNKDGSSTNQMVYWCIPMDGKDTKQGFLWWLKPELAEALTDWLYVLYGFSLS